MSDKIYVKTKEEFNDFISKYETTSVNFESQANNLLESNEIIFTELEDGFMTIRRKRGFGLSKGKIEIYVCPFGGVPQRYNHKDLKKGIAQFLWLHKEGHDFFYVKGLE